MEARPPGSTSAALNEPVGTDLNDALSDLGHEGFDLLMGNDLPVPSALLTRIGYSRMEPDELLLLSRRNA